MDMEDELSAEIAANRRRRKDFLDKLLGTADPVDRQAPAAIDNFDALLGEHAAQLRSAARYTMGFAVCDDVSIDRHPQMISSLTRLIQANVAIAKVLKKPREKSKTVHGGEAEKDAQD